MLLPLLAKKHETERDERKEREKRGVETRREMCAQVFVMQRGKDGSGELCFSPLSVPAVCLSI